MFYVLHGCLITTVGTNTLVLRDVCNTNNRCPNNCSRYHHPVLAHWLGACVGLFGMGAAALYYTRNADGGGRAGSMLPLGCDCRSVVKPHGGTTSATSPLAPCRHRRDPNRMLCSTRYLAVLIRLWLGHGAQQTHGLHMG